MATATSSIKKAACTAVPRNTGMRSLAVPAINDSHLKCTRLGSGRCTRIVVTSGQNEWSIGHTSDSMSASGAVRRVLATFGNGDCGRLGHSAAGHLAEEVPRVVAALLGSATINNVINRLWAMGVHWLMHESKLLYRAVHKRHHCQIRDFCALSAWQDSTLEFVLMEVFGVFLFAQLFNPLPWHFHVLFALINGVGAAIDHSAFYIPGTIIDGRYKWS